MNKMVSQKRNQTCKEPPQEENKVKNYKREPKLRKREKSNKKLIQSLKQLKNKLSMIRIYT